MSKNYNLKEFVHRFDITNYFLKEREQALKNFIAEDGDCIEAEIECHECPFEGICTKIENIEELAIELGKLIDNKQKKSLLGRITRLKNKNLVNLIIAQLEDISK